MIKRALQNLIQANMIHRKFPIRFSLATRDNFTNYEPISQSWSKITKPPEDWRPTGSNLNQTVTEMELFVKEKTKTQQQTNRFKLQKKYKEIELFIEQTLLRKLNELNPQELAYLLVIVNKMGLDSKKFVLEILREVNRRDPKIWSKYAIFYIMKNCFDNCNSTRWKVNFNRLVEMLDANQEKLDMNFYFSFLTELSKVKNKNLPPLLRIKLKSVIKRIIKLTGDHLKADSYDQMPLSIRNVVYRPAYLMLLLKHAYIGDEGNFQIYSLIEQTMIHVAEYRLKAKQLTYKSWLIFYASIAITPNGGQKLLAWGVNKFDKDEIFRKGIMNGSQENMTYVISRHINFQIYKIFKTLPIETIGGMRVLKKCPLPQPPLHRIIKQLISVCKNPDASFQVLPVLYPEFYSNLKVIASQQVNVSNEFNNHVNMCLTELGIPFKAEVMVAGRFCDLMIGNDTIIEIDGDIHTSSYMNKFKTLTRNYMILYKGLKVIVVNIEEYHNNQRNIKELLKKKLDLLKNNPDIIMIQ